MEKFPKSNIDNQSLLKKYYKPSYSSMFNKIKGIKAPVKNDIIMALLDGKWHSETDLIRLAKKQQHNIIGPVLLGTMINSLNHLIKNNYVEKQFVNGEMYYKISDNYVGLTRAAYTKYFFNNKL
ncbi:MAG: hypothetical protein ACFFAH_04350 [Promethearchaeota archaeon]